MLLALVCLWIGFAAGLICASLMRVSGDERTRRNGAEPLDRLARGDLAPEAQARTGVRRQPGKQQSTDQGSDANNAGRPVESEGSASPAPS